MHNNQRRAITPSPEKASIGMARRAITPTPIRNNATAATADYQNLSVIQNKIFNGVGNNDEGGYVTRKGLEQQQQQQLLQHQHQQYQNLNVIPDQMFVPNENGSGDVVDGMMRSNKDGMMHGNQQHPNLQRSLSAESTQLQDGLSIPDHLNQPRRRDSGNWSGDRNSASSSSSTTLDGPYMYLMGKRSGGHTPSPTRLSQNSGSPAPTGNGLPQHQFFDAGYDSYSLSSTDSYPPKHHNSSQLAKIPESVVLSGDCERLCKEADDLLEKSQYSEKIHDLESALSLCNKAANKARAALNAPYSNPHTMTFARMKHNTCVMRARSLHRRLLIEKGISSNADFAKDQQYMCAIDLRNNVNGSGSLRHMRQNSKENMLTSTNKSIEIYATLPKKGKSPFKLIDPDDAIEPDVQPVAPIKTERESRTLSIFGRGRRSEDKEKEKRSRSEDRNKHAREFSVIGAEPLLVNAKDTLKKHKEDKDEKCEKDKPNKKQHKVRRKILMGGLIRRKNRSMPDLTDANAQESEKETSTPTKTQTIAVAATVDDSAVMIGGGVSNSSENGSSISGYLSEGHFEYQTIITGGNPNLERSKLMRKNIQNGLAIRQQLTQVKVPPPPPLRTNSTLSQQQLQMHQQQMEKEMMPAMPGPIQPFHQANVSLISNMSSNTSMSEDSCQTIITTCAVVHQEQSPLQKQQQKDSNAAIDEVDSRFDGNIDLPPYPSPPASSCHSRQASEEFPPPPPTNELIEHPNNGLIESSQAKSDTMSILAQLQQRQQLLKQQKLNGTKQMPSVYDANQKSVKDLASRFEQIKLPYAASTVAVAVAEPVHQQLMRSSSASQEILNTQQKPQIRTQMNGLLESSSRTGTPSMLVGGDESSTAVSYDEVDNVPSPMIQMPKNGLSKSASAPYLAPTKSSPYELPPSQIAEEMREVEMLNNVMHQTLHPNGYNNNNSTTNNVQTKMPERTKKKSVSFCDQVILVATADDDEDDDFIPNPILERVLRTANYGNGIDMVDSKMLMQQQQNILRLQSEPQNRQQIMVPLQGSMTNENGYRQDLRAEAQKMQLMMHHQQESRLPSQNQIPVPMYGQEPDQMSKQSMQSMPMTNGGYNSPTIDHIQRSPVYNHSPMMNGMHQQAQPPRLVNNGMPSAYMQVPNMNYVKSQRVPNFVPNGYVLNGNNSPTSNSSVYQMPPHAPKNSLSDSVPQQQMYHHLPPLPQHAQPLQNGFPTAYQRIPIPHANLAAMQQHFAATIAKAPTMKKVSFEPGTKGETDAIENTTPPTTTTASTMDSTLGAVTSVPTRVFNNSAIVKASAKAVQCNLCRKKHVIAPSIYCSDCEFYMSRFQPRV